MKKLVLLILILTFCLPSFAQLNLIPNPSFEEYDCIPDSYFSSFKCVKEWFNPSPSNNTADYFHALSPDNGSDYSANVPNNWLGSQPSIDGDAYIMLHQAPNRLREYASVKLTEPLEKGRLYEISFYVAKIPNPGPYTHSVHNIGCSGQGVLFEMHKRSHIPDSLITEPHYYNPDIIDTYQTWEFVEGIFIADSAYQYMLVGNFLSLADPRFQSTRPFPHNYSRYVTCYFDKFELTKTARKASIDYQKDQDCFPVRLDFRYNNIYAADSLKWTFDDGTVSTARFPEQTYQEPGTYIVRLATKERGKTYYYTDTIVLEQAPLPIADFEVNETLVMNSPINFENLSTDAISYEWDFGDGNTSEQVNPWHTYTEPNDYTVTLTAYNSDGCFNTISYPIYITCGGLMNVNVFTPNSDGINDEFSFDSLQICQDFSITIFDRWGRLVFETQDPYQPWDGDEQPSGTYYYLIRYRNGGQEQGYVTLIR